MQHSDTLFRRVARHTGIMGSGKIAGGVLHLASLALAARMLGPVQFGMLMLIRSYAQTAGGLAKFQSWQAVIRFGTPLVTRDDRRGFGSLVAFTGGLDLLTGGIAMAIALGLLPAIGTQTGIDTQSLLFAALYCLAIPGMAATTPTGVLRLYERFDQLAWQSLITPAVRLTGLVIAWSLSAPFWAYGLAWLLSDLVGDGYLWVVGWRELRRRGIWQRRPDGPSATLGDHPGILRFILSTNISGTLDTLFGPLSALVIGARLGAEQAGLYRMALAVLDAVGKPAELAMRSFYPEIARLRDAGNVARFHHVVTRAVMIAAGFGTIVSLLVAGAAPGFIRFAMGHHYAAAIPLLQVVGISVLASMIVFPLEAALLAQGRAGYILARRAIATGLGFALLFVLLDRVGTIGAGWALVLSSFTLALLLSPVLRQLRPRGAKSDAS